MKVGVSVDRLSGYALLASLWAALAGCSNPSPETHSVPSCPEPSCPEPSCPEPSCPEPSCPEPEGGASAAWLSRVVAISDLPDIAPMAHGSRPATGSLGRRSQEGDRSEPPDLVIRTRCGTNWCVDGLSAGGIELIPARLDGEERAIAEASGHWRERVIRLEWHDDDYVSVYVAQTEYSGGAHANDTLACRTFDRRTGRSLRLSDVLPRSSATRLLTKVGGLLAPDRAIDEVGRPLEGAGGFGVDLDRFRLDRTAGYEGARPEIILCAEGSYPAHSANVLELRVEAMPVAYLLR